MQLIGGSDVERSTNSEDWLDRRRLIVGLAAGFGTAVFAVAAAPAYADPLATDTVHADPNAVLSFERPDISSIPAGNHSGPVVVASADLPRPTEGKLYAPLETLVATSPFGYRINPLTGQPGEFHWGQDFAGAAGTRVYSADAGVVRAAGWHPWGGGNRVEIDHGNGLVTTYNHMQAIAVKAGDSVSVSQVVGLVGQTGSATGPHLHFETHLNKVYKDPTLWEFIPIKQTSPVGKLTLTDYSPANGQTPATENWDVPGQADAPAPGETVSPAPAPAPTPAPPGPAAPTTSSSTPSSTASKPSSSPSPSSTPSPSPTPSSKPSPTPTPTATPTPSPAATASPSPTPSPTATASPTASPTVKPASSPTASPSPTPSPTSTATNH